MNKNLTLILILATTQLSWAQLAQFNHWEAKNFNKPTNTTTQVLTSGNADVTITVDFGDTIAPIMPTQFGVNSNFRSGNSIINRVEKYKPFGAFRFPAGSGSNLYFWDCNIPSEFLIDINPICGTSNNKLSLDNFITFKNNANGEPTVVVNYFYARYGITPEGTRQARVQQAADYAAAFVKKLNIEMNAGIKYWEIGNECYGAWETGYDVNGSIVTGTEYGEDFQVFAETMKAMDNSIKVGAVLWHKTNKDWNKQVLNKVQNHADFLVVHHYFTPFDSNSDPFSELTKLGLEIEQIKIAVATSTDKPANYFPIFFTEYNIQGAHTTTINNALFTTELLAHIISHRINLATMWVNEWKIIDNNSKGILALQDPDQPDYSPRSVYTPFYYYKNFFGDYMINASQNTYPVKSYASVFSSGEVGIVIVNYNDQSQSVGFDWSNTNFTPNKIYWNTVHANTNNIGDKKFYINGVSGNTPGGGPIPLSDVPTNTASFSENTTLELPKYSITFMVIQPQTVATNTVNPRPNLAYPTPTNGIVYLELNPNEKIQHVFSNNQLDILPSIPVEKLAQNKYRLDFSELTDGIYYICTNQKTYKAILIKK